MKIVFVITELNVGGAERALTELALGVQQQGHQPHVLSIGSEPKPPRGELVERLVRAGVPTEFGGFDHWSRLLSASHWLSRRIADLGPDICQSFLFHANCLTARVGVGHQGTRVVGGIRVAESKRVRLAVERRAIRRMDHLVCVSQRVQAFAIEKLAAPREKCSVINNGVDLQRFGSGPESDWTDLGWPANSKVVIFVGRFHPQKGLELIQSRLEQMIAGDPLRRFLFVGQGPLESELCRWAERVGKNVVHLMPWQPEIAPLLRAASLLILPSHYEGMPNVVLEAMAAGRPVVCSRVEGSDELLGDELLGGDDPDAGRNERNQRQGFIAGDGDEMARLVDAFLSDQGLRDRIGRANQDFVRDHFSILQMVDRYVALYESLG